VSWPNGAQSWKQSNWSLLAGRDVVIWPDNDGPGIGAARQIANQLPHHNARARVLTPPDGVPPAWDVGDAIRDGWDRNRLMAFIDPPKPSALWHSDEAWSEADIPRRAWVARGFLERRNVTIVAGAGAAGKSMLFKAWAVASALGVPFSRFSPVSPLRVLSYNVEDDLDEERRRLSATLRHFNATPADLASKLRIVGPNDVGTLVERDPATGRLKVTEAMADLCQHIETFRPDILMLDPLVELHTVEENDNTGLRSVIANFRQLSVRYDIATALAHHVRKGAISPGDPDMVRGAGSIVGAARVVFTACGMSEDEAVKLGITPDGRKSFFRLDGAKINHAPLQDAEWFERIAHQLDNGEDVAAAVPWQPPRDVITSNHFDVIEAEVRRGFHAADAYCFRAGSPRSFANLCQVHGIATKDGAKEVEKYLISKGYKEYLYRDGSRNKPKGIRSEDGFPTTVEWLHSLT
jgi:RecA-family ATPase